mgnify:FL=1
MNKIVSIIILCLCTGCFVLTDATFKLIKGAIWRINDLLGIPRGVLEQINYIVLIISLFSLCCLCLGYFILISKIAPIIREGFASSNQFFNAIRESIHVEPNPVPEQAGPRRSGRVRVQAAFNHRS